MAGPDDDHDDRDDDRLLRPLMDRLSILDGRTAAIGARLEQLTAAVGQLRTSNPEAVAAPLADRLAAVESTLLELRSAQLDPNQLVAPLADRLALVTDRTTALGSQLHELASAVGGIRAGRPELQGMVASVNDQLGVVADTIRGAQERLDTLASSVNELHANRPDMSSSLRALATLIESIRVDGAETRARIDALATGAPLTVPVRAPADSGEQFERVRQLLATLTERQNDVRAQSQQVLERSTAAVEGIEGLHQRLESLARAAAAAPPPIGPGPDAATSPDLAPLLTPVTEGIDGLRDQLRTVGDAVAATSAAIAVAPAPAAATVDSAVVSRLERAAADVNAAREVLASGIERVLGRLDADTNRILDTMGTGDPDVRETVQRVDAGLVELRRELDRFATVGSPTPSPQVASTPATSMAPSQPSIDVEAIRRELQDIRVEVVASGRMITGLQSDLRRGDDTGGGAGAALVASAAAAMARLEARMDGEFDALSRQLDTLGALMKEVADTVERNAKPTPGPGAASEPSTAAEVGPAPDVWTGERVRTVASQLLDSLRAAARNRPGRRPPELNR